MTWNYRIIDHGTHLALHEVYYDYVGEPQFYTADPATFVADSEEGADGIIGGLEKALHDAKHRGVLSVSVFGNKPEEPTQ